MKNAVTRRVFVGALAIGLAFASSNAVLAQDKVRFQTDWIPSGEHAMYYGGWSKGIYAKHGIDITITRGYGSGDTVTKVAGGAADFGVADIAAVFTARARSGVPVKTIAVIYNELPHSLFVLKSSGITDFKGLEGKKIGITPGNSHRFYFPEVAKKAGTDPNKIVWTNMDGAAMAAQLIAKNIAAAPFYSIHSYYINKAATKAGEEIVVLPFVSVGFKIYAASIITSDKMIKDKPDLVKRFLAATKEVFEWARDNPDEACKLHVERFPEVQLDDCLASVRAVMPFVFNAHSKEFGFGKEGADRLKFSWATIASANDLKPDFDYKQAIDTSLVPK